MPYIAARVFPCPENDLTVWKIDQNSVLSERYLNNLYGTQTPLTASFKARVQITRVITEIPVITLCTFWGQIRVYLLFKAE